MGWGEEGDFQFKTAEYNLKFTLSSSNTSKSEKKKLIIMKSQPHRKKKKRILCRLEISFSLKERKGRNPQPGVGAEVLCLSQEAGTQPG